MANVQSPGTDIKGKKSTLYVYVRSWNWYKFARRFSRANVNLEFSPFHVRSRMSSDTKYFNITT